ncbi:substrate-binding domain-containing protein [Nakamurella sp. YIM 132087]|uniref:Substrate-binding domain-containing protein n=1 Tax=Nakamurella alba TaxID=2665158 RepID=A0A7K1FEN2_9ACTN|nr:sugar ABC transporter substrate-binding protein [Nakamurella alba]MTD12530.1 substrate-binding domain-containing protein [Nakamurella alba]
MPRSTRLNRIVAVAALAVLVPTMLAACGSDTTSTTSSTSAAGSGAATAPGSSTGGAGTASPSAGEPDFVAAAKAAVEKYTAVPAGPDDLQPFTPAAGPFKVGISGCGQNIPSCQTLVAAATEAVEELGWTPVFYDGTQSQSGWIAGMSSLINQDVDGIIKFVQPDSFMPNSMEDAKAAGIPVVCGVCGNYAEDPVASPSLANTDVDYAEQGKVLADWVIAAGNGTSKVSVMDNKLATPVRLRTEGFVGEMGTCSTCTVLDNTEIAQDATILDRIRSNVAAKLAQYPEGDINYIESPTDAYFEAIAPPIESSGRTDVKLVAYDASAAGLDSLRQADGILEATVDTPLQWLAYAAVDQMARQLSDQPVTKDVSIPFRLITRDNVPAGDEPPTGFDHKAYYAGLWGK